MKLIKYDRVAITPIPAWDAYLVEWARKKFFQIRIINGKIRTKINGLKVFKTMEIDGIEMECRESICRECLLKYGEKIKARKSLLGWWYYCPQCGEKNL